MHPRPIAETKSLAVLEFQIIKGGAYLAPPFYCVGLAEIVAALSWWFGRQFQRRGRFFGMARCRLLHFVWSCSLQARKAFNHLLH
ncbi:MAG: hypothetical protein VXY59_04975 [Pseudomonadota bacterium]|nr:hypothetical protein [Pseudomonadota bacterium]